MSLFSGILGIAGGVVGGIYGGPAGAAAGYSVGSGVGGMIGGSDSQEQLNSQNNFNANQAALNRSFQAEQNQKAMDFSASQVSQQQDFQRWETGVARNYDYNMATTQYQRAVQDLKQAGLNPMLAYQNGGAAVPTYVTPSGSSASGVSSGGSMASAASTPSAAQNAAATAAANSTAADVATKLSQVELNHQAAQTEVAKQANIASDTTIKNAQGAYAPEFFQNQKENLSQQSQGQALTNERMRTMKESGAWLAQSSKTHADAQQSINSAANLAIMNNVLRGQASQAGIDTSANTTWWRKYVNPYLQDIGDVIHGHAGFNYNAK